MNKTYQPTNSNYITHYLTIFSIAIAFASIYTSKAGLSIALVLILIATMIKFVVKDDLINPKHQLSNLSMFLVATYIIGLALSFLPLYEFHDLLWFAQKGAYLLVIPLFFIPLTKHKNIAVSFSLLGLFVAMGYALLLLSQSSLGQRSASFWDVGRWSEILAYAIAALIPCLHSRKVNQLTAKTSFLILTTIILCCASLLITGSRGPLLFLFIALFIYYLLSHIKLFILFLIFSICFLLAVYFIPELNIIYQRIISIFSSSDNSNNARFLMWTNAIHFVIYNIQNNFSLFLFGIGDKNIEQYLISFLQSIGSIDAMQESVRYQLSFNDFHNAYLDTLIKAGAVFFALYISVIGYITFTLIKFISKGVTLAWSGLIMLLTHLGIGLVYSNGMEYQTVIFYLMMTLILAYCVPCVTQEERINNVTPN